MKLDKRIEAFAELGRLFKAFTEENKLQESHFSALDELKLAAEKSQFKNNWFTPDNINYAISSWADILNKKNLEAWLAPYAINNVNQKTIGLIMAGNIPLVGFHDMLSVLITGHYVKIKTSSKDQLLLPVVIRFLQDHDDYFKEAITMVEGKLEHYDAVIATGSNNTARYFEYYFGDKPNIIRKNRTSVAVLTGQESKTQLEALGDDIFRYFGLGCRNVSKIYVPKNYDLNNIFGGLFPWKHLIEDKKYANNYDYNKAVYLMSEFDFLDNGFAMLKEDTGLHSPIASIFYEYYDDQPALLESLTGVLSDQIQCIVASEVLPQEIAFGATQQPGLSDYADNVDTVDFLLKI